MKCEEVNDLLSAFQDRELSVEEMTAIEGHLKDCAECAAKSNIMVGLSKIVKHWEGVRSSETARRLLFEKASTVPPGSGRAFGPLALWILGMIAAALLGGGAVALAYWYLGREHRDEPPVPSQTRSAAACVAVEGRVELIQPDGARLDLRGRRDLALGQEVFCDTGSAAQLELSGGASPVVLVLRGSGSLKLASGELRLKGGRLMFRLPPGEKAPGAGQKLVISAGQQWRVEAAEAGTVGLVDLGRDDAVRLAVLSGNARLTGGGGSSGPSVAAGKEVTLAADGRLDGPRDLASKDGFGLLTPGLEGGK